MRKFAIAPALGAWMALIAAPALAADAAKEVKTAAHHAGFASASDTLPMVRAHLHHTLNCLEGPKGADFDAKAMNPCKDQGMGAIPDSPPDKRKALEAAALRPKWRSKNRIWPKPRRWRRRSRKA